MTQTQEILVEQIDPKLLKPHPDNPRIEIDENSQEFMRFADNIKARSVLQPILGTRIVGEMFILAGHRRTRAAIARGLARVPVIFHDMAPGEYPEDYFLSENGQRNDLSPLEDARAIDKLRQRILTDTAREPAKGDLCRRLGIPMAHLNQALALLEMPDRVQMLFHRRELPMSSSLHLLRLIGFPNELETMANRLLTRQITGKSLATLVARRLQDLEASGEKTTNGETAAPSRVKSHFGNSHVHLGGGGPAITRAAAVDNLNRNTRNKISLFEVGVLVESICCQCGMIGNDTVCATCPLPKLINGIVGRSNRDSSGFESDDEDDVEE